MKPGTRWPLWPSGTGPGWSARPSMPALLPGARPWWTRQSRKMRWLSKKFALRDACLVADTYTSARCSSMKYINEENLLDSLAEAYTRIYLNIGVDQMADTVIEMVHKYHVDGLAMHSNRSCKPYSFGQYDIERIVKKKTGIPVLMIEADMVDERNFAEGQIDTRIDVFVEMLEKQK